MKKPVRAKVILRSCREYDAEKIRVIFRDAIRELGVVPTGRTLVKPNLVTAGKAFPHAFTRPEVGEGMLLALRDVAGPEMTELAAGERCGITMPTRYAMAESGWDAMLTRVGVKRYHFEEEPQVEIALTHEGRLRDYLFTPEPVARADFFVNLPKFKAHPWTTVTFGTKGYIGIQDDRHRLIDHDHKLNEKIRDLQFIIQPQLIAIDAGPGEKVVFIGDCSSWKGKLQGEDVSITSTYKDRSTLDPHHAKHDDIFKKLAVTTQRFAASAKDPWVRMEGCPVSVAEQVLALVAIGGLKNPYLDPSQVVPFTRSYLAWRGRVMLNVLQNKRYQRDGRFTERGRAAGSET